MSRRLLHVIHYPVFGGPHNQAERLAAPLRDKGWETIALLPDEPGNAADRLRASGLEVLTMPLGRLRASANLSTQLRFATMFPLDVQRIRRVIQEREIDLVVVGGLVNPHAAVAARTLGVPVVWQLLDTRAPMALRKLIMPIVLSLSDAVMSTGSAVAAEHPGVKTLGERLIVFYPPVDTATFMPQLEIRDSVRDEWSVAKEDCVIGSVANINPQKGIDNLIDSFAIVRRKYPTARLLLIGSEYDTHKSYSMSLRAQIKTHGLMEGKDVFFLGMKNDVERQLQGVDIFVLGSVPLSEGAPTSIIEAMACELPVVATDVGAVPELVEEGETGFVVPAQDPESMATAVLKILDSAALHSKMGTAGRRSVLKQFDIQACVEAHLRAFDVAVAHAGARQGQARAA